MNFVRYRFPAHQDLAERWTVEQWTDFRLISMLIWPLYSFICLALTGKCGENSWWVFGRNWFNLLTGIGVVCLRRRGTLIKCQLKQKVIIFFFEQRSFQLSIYLGRLNSEGGTSCFVKLYCGKRFLKAFFTDLINGQKQIRGTHVTRAVLSCWRLLDHASRVELNFVVLLNFDNVLEGPRSTRRNHHCDIGFSH